MNEYRYFGKYDYNKIEALSLPFCPSLETIGGADFDGG